MQAAMAPAKDSLDELYENGFCSMYGIGGKTSFFGPDIPKPNKISAPKLSDADKSMLLSICGASWDKAEHACCDAVQLSQLKTNLAKADALISSCPACKENFYQLFCHFTCSPNQSQFVDVTSTTTATNGEPIVEELDFYIDKSFASSFYDSCKNIKFGVTNGYAMDLIGGGATNYTQFLKFLGDKKPQIGGSPFQINYKYDLSGHDNLTLFDTTARSCNDSDINFACACSDCPQVCPVLDELPIPSSCEVYGLSCTTFTILSSYFIVLISFFSILKFIRYKKNRSTMTRSLINDDDLLDSNSNLNSSFASQDTIHLLNIQSRQSYVINNKLESVFYKLGFFCSSYPKFVIAISLAVALILSSFVSFLEFEKNPVNLWVSPHSDAFIQKGIFDENFGPFYRTQQIIISNSTGDSVLQDFDFIQWWFETESKILDLRTDVMIDHSNYSVGYQDICFKPLEGTCIVESFTQYFDGDIGQLTEANYKQKLKSCANSPVECLPSFQQPIKKNIVFGGNEDDDILTSQAVVITLLNNNNNDPFTEQILKASGWEHELENYILNNVTAEAKKRNLDISFMTEISLEKELGKSTNTDIRIVVISYLIMFAYASMALSINPNNLSMADASFVTPWGRVAGTNAILKYLSKTKISLGLIGILIVLLSVLSSMGFWSLFHLKSTLIIAEVIPFLILAVGVDNIFLISSEFCNVEKLSITSSLSLEQKVAKTMANIGPSILLSSSCQFLCFILGTFVGMPAVKNFSLYTSVAVVFNTLLQITTFVSIFSLDQRRILSGRLDLLPFIKIEHNLISLPETSQGEEPLDSSNSLCQLLSSNDGTNESNFIKEFFRDKFGPFLFEPGIMSTVLIVIVSIFGISLSLSPSLKMGLDQRIALPNDSYLIDYFDDVYKYLDVGPPIYFVVEDLNLTDKANQQKICSKFTTCDSFSLVNIIEQEFKRSNESTVAEPVASWLDDYLMWLNPDLDDCCRIKKSTGDFCDPFDSPRACQTCYFDKDWDYQMDGFPEGEEFMKYFQQWIEAPSYPCPLGGKAPYSTSVFYNNATIERSAFRTSHTPLRSQDDFIGAYHNSLRIVKEIKEKQDISLFAYSPFYIFFVQYENIRSLAFVLLSIGLVLVGFISMLLLGSIRNAIVLVVNLVMIIASIVAWMVISNISLNAVSLVNLLICLGLSVEFSVHLFKHFNYNDEHSSRMERAQGSLVYIGATTLSGITLTKLIGIGVLSFTTSKIFRVYYFQMWAGLVLIASIHALVVAPILLALFGSRRVYSKSTSSSIGCDDLIRRLRDSM